MKDFSERFFIGSVILVFSLGALFLVLKIINVPAYSAIVTTYLLIALTLYKRDKIEELTSNLFGWKAIRDEVYAKIEELKKLEKRVNKSETETSNNKTELRQMIRQYIRLQILILGYRHKFPMPEKVVNEINKELMILTDKAFDSKTEANKTLQ